MIILGIDPGYDRLGIAVIEKTAANRAGKETLLYSACFQTSSKDTMYTRLEAVGREIARVIAEFEPQVLALETLFITKNQKTGMRVAEARGIIIYEALRAGLPVHEYGPMEIKAAVTGSGASDKQQMIKMVHLLIAMPPKKTEDDEYDAVAVALTHSARVIHNRQMLQKYPGLGK